jgi:hypothetical protein
MSAEDPGMAHVLDALFCIKHGKPFEISQSEAFKCLALTPATRKAFPQQKKNIFGFIDPESKAKVRNEFASSPFIR